MLYNKITAVYRLAVLSFNTIIKISDTNFFSDNKGPACMFATTIAYEFI